MKIFQLCNVKVLQNSEICILFFFSAQMCLHLFEEISKYSVSVNYGASDETCGGFL